MTDHNQTWIDSPAKLSEFCQHLQQQTFFTIDTEFVREKNYYPVLCLIQIATNSQIACIDPLAIDDLSPLAALLHNENITKVFHAARQDIEAFYYLFKQCPRPVFDTQIAASLLGMSDQIGYANLVNRILGVQLDKKHTRTDWRKRPLSDEQISYAADDVRYLYQIYPVLLKQLTELGREDWLQSDFDFLSDPSTYEVDYEHLWRRVAGHQKLKPRQLTILKELAIWRERMAQKTDRPRKWIAADDTLITLAIQTPQTIAEINEIRSPKGNLSDKFKQHILDIIKQAAAIPEEQWVTLPKFHKLSVEQDSIVDVLMGLAKKTCAANNIAMGSIITRKDMEKLVCHFTDNQHDSKLPILNGWRHALVGHVLEDFLAGKINLNIKDRQLNQETV